MPIRLAGAKPPDPAPVALAMPFGRIEMAVRIKRRGDLVAVLVTALGLRRGARKM
jgi:hypothetical protein